MIAGLGPAEPGQKGGDRKQQGDGDGQPVGDGKSGRVAEGGKQEQRHEARYGDLKKHGIIPRSADAVTLAREH